MSIVLLLTSVVSVCWPLTALCPLLFPTQLQICTVKTPTRPIYQCVVLQILIMHHWHHTSAGYIQT